MKQRLSNLPSSRRAINLLKTAGCSKNVIKHCKSVSRLAVKIAKKLAEKGINVNIELVKIGGLLHDIGRSKTHGIDHALVGSEIARSYGLPEDMVKIIERHIGSGITADEASKLGLPRKDFIPISLEEKIVSYADKLISGDHEMEFSEALEKFAIDLGASHPAVPRLKQLHNEIQVMLGDLPDGNLNTT